jgi:diguanylate cyclase (GGDEF)-like protein/PAS domain S-box-containing protein
VKSVVRVLLVDDDDDSRILVQAALRGGRAEHQIDWVPRPQDAVVELTANRHDVCLLDYRLGSMTGLEVLAQARAGGSRVPVILLTAHDSADLDWAAMEAGAADFLSKSALATHELERSIRYALESARHLKTLQAQARLLSAVIENIGDGVMICGIDTRVEHVNAAYSRITGYGAAELEGREADLFDENTRRVLEAKGEWRGERVGRRKDGSMFAERVVLRLVTDAKGEPSHYVSLHSDVTRQREREQKLHELAHHDALTGLPNRLLFSDRLSQAVFQADRRGKGFSVLYVDLDNFKPINDRWGHDQGDLVLKEVSRRLLACLRKEDTAARLGGDEFAVVLSEGRDGAAVVAQKIITSISAPLTGPKGKPLGQKLGVSLGIAVYPDDGTSAVELLERADEAMYSVKHGLKNSFAFFSPAQPV